MNLLECEQKFNNFFKSVIDESGEDYFVELVYRFSTVQFRDTKNLILPQREIIEKLLEDYKKELGFLFEEFANKSFEKGLSEKEINGHVKQWILNFQRNLQKN